MPSKNKYLVLSEHCALKLLERPCLYDIKDDQLYELDQEAFDFLKECNDGGKKTWPKENQEFIQCCLEKEILKLTNQPGKQRSISLSSPIPSLRYLEVQITKKCNLRCRHCYLGESKSRELGLEAIQTILDEFQEIQGLRLLITGGEPQLHSNFWEINEVIPCYDFRTILLSNGSMISRDVASRLNFQEVQISLDGMEKGHDFLRGKGSFAKTIKGIENLIAVGKKVSLATMVHSHNTHEFEKMEELIRNLGIKEWSVDVPCMAGRLLENLEVILPYEKAAAYMRYGFGGGLYSSSSNYACGSHLCAVMSDGQVYKCAFFLNQPLGRIGEGLRECWGRFKPIKLEDLSCNCEFIKECRGGCRYRAFLSQDVYSPDPVKCYFYGVSK